MRLPCNYKEKMQDREVETDVWGQSQKEEELRPRVTEQMKSVEAEIGPSLVIRHHSGNRDADELCNNVPNIQEDKTPAGDGTRQHSDSHQGYKVRTVWRKWICFWLKRKYTFKAFTNPQSKSNQPSASGSLWQSLSCRHLLLLFRSECFLDDVELAASQHKVCGDPCSDARVGLFDDFFSHGRGRNEETAFSDMFQQVCTQMRLHCWEQSQDDTEELLAEEEEEGETVYGSYH